MSDTTTVSEELKITELGSLPLEWDVVKLGDVASVTSGGSAPQGKEFFNGENPFVRVQHLELESTAIRRWDLITDGAVKEYGLRLYPKGTIVFPKSGASIYLEKRAILPRDAYIVSHLCAVISESPLVDQNFLFYYLRFLRLAEGKAEGYPTLNLTEIKNKAIACPPLPEQKKIAAVLSAVQEAKEKTEAVIRATRDLKKSLTKHLFTYGPVSPEEAEDVPLKETEIGLVPEAWEIVRLGNLTEVVRGGSPRPKGDPKYFSSQSTEVHWITISDLTQYRKGKFITHTNEYLTEEGKKKSRFLRAGEFVVTNSGTVGIPAFLGVNGCIHDGYLAFLNIDTGKLHKDYLYYWFSQVRPYLERIAPRGTQANLNTTIAKNLQIAIPPLRVQREIADTLSAIDNRIEVGQNKKKALEGIFRTLLNNLMTGKIRVQ